MIYKTMNHDCGALYSALQLINNGYNNNIRFKREPEYIGADRNGRFKYRFTLTVHNSSAAGARRSPSGRRIAAACWHAHGHFFDALFDADPSALIIVADTTGERTIDRISGNWRDRQVGSIFAPYMYSELCDCGE